jgi:hypothetical protein
MRKIFDKKYLKNFALSVTGDLSHNFNNDLKYRALELELGVTTIGKTQY